MARRSVGQGVGAGAATVTTTEVVRAALKGKRRDLSGWVFEAALLLTLLLSLGLLVILLGDIFAKGIGVFSERGLNFVTSGTSSITARAGVWQGLVGSLLLMIFVIVVAFPLGIGAAVYIEEYAKDTPVTRFINANIRNLAGVPSVVYGLLGLAIFVEAFSRLTGGKSVISGGVTLAVLVLPIVIIVSSEALRAVPNSIREAGYGVGATRWEVVRSHVLPSAAPGILTGTILALARALGETAPLIIVGAVTGFFAMGSASLAEQLQGRYTSLPTLIFDWSRQPGREEITAAAIMVLMLLLLIMNTVAIVLRNRYERKW
jgi:phosphate transport system permease protein